MKQLLKCEYCDKPLNSNNTVFIEITRYDRFGRRVKEKHIVLLVGILRVYL